MKPIELLFLFIVITVGVFAALIAWTLIVKNQLQAQIAASPGTLSAINLISAL